MRGHIQPELLHSVTAVDATAVTSKEVPILAQVLYCCNQATQDVAADGIVNLGSIVRRTCGSGIDLAGNGITIYGTGYYTVDVSVTFTAPTAGNVSVTLLKDGTAVPGAIGFETISTASTEYRTIAFTCEVRNGCCNNYSTLTLYNGGVEASYVNVAVRVKRDA